METSSTRSTRVIVSYRSFQTSMLHAAPPTTQAVGRGSVGDWPIRGRTILGLRFLAMHPARDKHGISNAGAHSYAVVSAQFTVVNRFLTLPPMADSGDTPLIETRPAI